MRQLPKNQTQIILDSIADGVFTVDADLRITSFNRAAEKITGVKKEEARGRHCWEVFKASICENRCALKENMKLWFQMITMANKSFENGTKPCN